MDGDRMATPSLHVNFTGPESTQSTHLRLACTQPHRPAMIHASTPPLAALRGRCAPADEKLTNSGVAITSPLILVRCWGGPETLRAVGNYSKHLTVWRV